MKLVMFDKTQKVSYFDQSKIVMNLPLKQLIITKNKEEGLNNDILVVSFDDNEFILKKNFIFIFGENKNLQSFMLECSSETSSQKIIDIITKVKKAPKTSSVNYEEFLQIRFFQPIINEMKINKLFSQTLKDLLLISLMEYFTDEQQKEIFIEFETPSAISETPFQNESAANLLPSSNEIPSSISNKRKQQPKTTNQSPNFESDFSEEETNCQDDNADDSDFSFNSDLTLSDDNIDEPLIKKPKITTISNYEIVEAPNFEIINYKTNGVKKGKLFHFPISDDRNQCYEYYWSKCEKCYICCGCAQKKKVVKANLCKKAATGDKYIELNSTKHVCNLRKYIPEKYCSDIILDESNFKIISFERNGNPRSRLFVFDSKNKNMCHEYFWNTQKKAYICCGCYAKDHGFRVQAIPFKNNQSKNCVRLKSQYHICELRKYEPDKYEFDKSKQIVKAPNFEIINFKNKGVTRNRLLVFPFSEKKLCYEYFEWNTHQCFKCAGCHGLDKSVLAKICQDSNGNDYIELNKVEHICEMRKYDSEKYTLSEMIYKPMYEIIENIFNGKMSKRLYIFVNDDKKLYYDFKISTQYKNNNVFACSKCRSKSHHVRAELCIDENDKNGNENEYVTLSKQQRHICEPLEYVHGFPMGEHKIITEPNFKLITREIYGGAPSKRLIIFISNKENLCYEYSYDKNAKNYKCLQCSNKKKNIYAKLFENQKNGKNNFVELCSKPHVCQPIKYVAANDPEKLIIKPPNFEFHSKTYKGIKTETLKIIQSKNNKKMVYEFYYKRIQDIYVCEGCKRKNKHITAKVFKNEKGFDFIKLNKADHVCNLQIN